MPIVELEQELSNILEENPVLEAVEDDGSDDLYDFDNNESNNLSEDIEDTQDKDKNLDNLVEKVTGDDWEEYIGYEKLDDISYKSTNDENAYEIDLKISYEEDLGYQTSATLLIKKKDLLVSILLVIFQKMDILE